MSAPPLATHLMLDALTEFARVVDALPAPGRGGAIGRLNPGVATLLHITLHVSYLDQFATGAPADPWVVEHEAAGTPPSFDEALEAFRRVHRSGATTLERLTAEDLRGVPLPEPLDGLSPFLVGLTLEYMTARTAAHTFAHAGELAALASLVRTPDLGLPGAMAATLAATEGTDEAPA